MAVSTPCRSLSSVNRVKFASLPKARTLVAACAMSLTHSACASSCTSSYTPRVRTILSYLEDHPMPVRGIPMEYVGQPSAPLPEVVVDLKAEDIATQQPQRHEVVVCLALLYLACGGVDQAHNLVTPLSWGSPTAYGGKPIHHSPAAQDAAYVHALVHRQEGEHDGEFGSGFSNANYWYRAAGEHAIGPKVLSAARKLAAGTPQLEQHVRNHGDRWQPSKFVSLCAQSVNSRDPLLSEFCGQLINQEWRLLFDHCHAKLQPV